MNNFQRALKHKNSSVIDEKIARLNEQMTTTGLYTVVKQTDGQEYVPPTFGDAPQGDFSDLESFTQNADNDNVDQLTADDADGTVTPILSLQDTSSFDFASGVSPRAMARQGRHAQGVRYGFIDSRNVFNEIFVIGGNAASGYGQSGIIAAGS